MFTYKITKAETMEVIATGQKMIRVDFQLLSQAVGEEPVVVAERSHGFDLDASADEIKTALQKVCETEQVDKDRADQLNAEAELNKNANDTIKNLIGEDSEETSV